MKALIFGAGGQDGTFITTYLQELGWQVFGYGHKPGQLELSVDVSNFEGIEQIIKNILPDYIFHLAAVSSTKHEFIVQNHKAIVSGTLAILEAVEKHIPNSKVFLASSGLVFKNEGRPITESDEFVIDTAYSLSRYQALQSARYFRRRGIKVYVGFLFNHESHLRPERSVARLIARGVVEVSQKRAKVINIGSMDVVKEWLWAGDVATAIVHFLNQDHIFEMCIGDGIGLSVRAYAEECCKAVGILSASCLIQDPEFKAEYPFLVSDPSKLFSIGWVPSKDITKLAKIMVEAELSR